MASAMVETYQSAEYQVLPHLDHAFDTFLERSPQQIIEQQMMSVFLICSIFYSLYTHFV